MARNGNIGIGIWGAGWVSGGHASAYKSTPGCAIVAVGSRRRESAARLARDQSLDCRIYDDYGEFLSDPDLDAVSICTPHALHPRNAIEGAEAGKHLFIEKPVALSLGELSATIDAVQRAGVVTAVGFVTRGTPLARRLREVVASGAIGEIYMIGADYWHARRGRPHYYKTTEEAGSAYMIGGVHAVDAARFITQLDITAVCSTSTQIPSAAEEGYAIDCADSLLVKYSNGAIGRVSAAVHGHMPYQFNIDILGDKGAIRNNRLFTKDSAEGQGFEVLPEEGPESGDVLDHAYPFLMSHFVDCIRRGEETEVSLSNAVNTHQVGYASEISKQRGGWVTLPLAEST